MGVISKRGGVARTQIVDPQYRFRAELPEQRGRGRRFGASSHCIQSSLVTPHRLDLPFTVPACKQLGPKQPVRQRPLRQLGERYGNVIGAPPGGRWR